MYRLLSSLATQNDSKIVLVVLDGLGDIPEDGTPLERAHTPNLDSLAAQGITGLTDPILPGVTPGSGPSHLALFGYNPLEFEIGRGVLEALGIGIDLEKEDVAARANFATISPSGEVIDRRAGRIPTSKCAELTQLLQQEIPSIDGVELLIRPGKEHRFCVVFRGEGLSDKIVETDPQKEGYLPKEPKALAPEAERSAAIVKKFIASARELLKDKEPANFVLLRGFAKRPKITSLGDLYKIKPAAIATYPMYRGIAKLVGMNILETGESVLEEFETLNKNYEEYDFFYLHIKGTDKAGEDGDFELKKKLIEEVDGKISILMDLNPECIVVTADHSTPCKLKSHSWHPNPLLLRSKYGGVDEVMRFTERDCARGGLGRIPATAVMGLMLANTLKLKKFGA